MKSRKCKKCQNNYPLEYYYRHPKMPDGRHIYCRTCMSEYRGNLPRSQLKPRIAEKSTIVITSAVVAAPVNRDALKSMLSFCTHYDAELVVLGMRTQTKALRGQPEHYGRSIAPFLCSELRINDNLYAIDLEINPQQVEPLTGLSKFGSKTGRESVIIAHTKQNLNTLGSLDSPRVHYTTGCITEPQYLSHTRTGRIAEQDHLLGGLIIDVLSKDKFLIQNFWVGEDGGFTNYGQRFLPTGTIEVDEAAAIVHGDLHLDSYNSYEEYIESTSFRVCAEQQEFFGYPSAIQHDFMSWSSTSHHSRNDAQARDMRDFVGMLEMASKAIHDWKTHYTKKLFIVKSNHDEHLSKYLEKGDFRDSGKALPEVCDFASKYFNYGDIYTPLGLESGCYLRPVEGDFKIAGCTVNLHGHKATAGVRGNPKAFARDFHNITTGHTHSPSARNKQHTVGYNGTSQKYAEDAPSNWLQANDVIYRSGMKQLVISIDGEWKPPRLEEN